MHVKALNKDSLHCARVHKIKPVLTRGLQSCSMLPTPKKFHDFFFKVTASDVTVTLQS